MDVIGNVKGAIEITKKLSELAKLHQDADAMTLVADLKLQLAEVRTQAADLLEEILELRKEIQVLKSSGGEELLVREGVYWSKANDDGPFCTACFDTQRKKVRIVEQKGPTRQIMKWRCPVCKAHFCG